MALSLSFPVFGLARSVPVLASVVLHASIAAGLVVSAAAGHSRAGTNAPVATVEATVDVETEAPVVTPVAAPARAEAPEPPPAHTHPYPVDPSHDAHPHDASLHHQEALPGHHDDDHHAEPAPGEAAEAAPALTSTGALPHFDLGTGAGAPAGAHVAANADGPGDGRGGAAAGAADDAVVPASSVQVAARLVRSVSAAYPPYARADEVEGDVAVEIVVDREGRVIDARVTRPAGHGFDEAALVAVRAYRFSPAMRDGHAVRVRMPWSVQFRLR